MTKVAFAVLLVGALVLLPPTGRLARGTGSIDDIAGGRGGGHFCALTVSGGVKCWGYGVVGQLGYGGTSDRAVPVDVCASISDGGCSGDGKLSQITRIAVGTFISCALTLEADVLCWGSDTATTYGPVPVELPGFESAVTTIAAGGFHACGALEPGGVMCWGYNHYGQLGDGTTTDSASPVRVQDLSDPVTVVAAGRHHTCAALATGGVECWGNNDFGQLGDGTTLTSRVPVDVVGLEDSIVWALAAGDAHTCALDEEGGVKCWGLNDYGQLGDGQGCGTRCYEPTDVVDLGDSAVALAAGNHHTCAVLAGGSLDCWGWNWKGQVGDGTTTNRLTPVQIFTAGDGATAVGAGAAHTCAATSGGVKCWGMNEEGQLGVGYISGTEPHPNPMDVVGLGPKPPPTSTPTETSTDTATSTPTYTPEPPVGGVGVFPDMGDESSGNTGAVLSAVIAAAGFVAVAGAAWNARRRWARR